MSQVQFFDLSNTSDSDIWFKDLYASVSDYCGPNYNPLVGSVIGSIIVGLSGIVPLLIIPIDGGEHFGKGAGSERLRLLLSFAVGGLLGDVFLHLLPEAWTYQLKYRNYEGLRVPPSMFCGLWVLTGLLVFIIAEKLFQKERIDDLPSEKLIEATNNNEPIKPQTKEIGGYLNLMANVIDNFTHGLAVGGSFLLSLRIGLLTTAAIMIHEVPHEVGDFAILLKSGFSRFEAAKAQIFTASSSLVGALTAYVFSGADDVLREKTSWILPFTAGGFLHIALVSVLPELIEETSPRESLKQLLALTLGILVMAALTFILED